MKKILMFIVFFYLVSCSKNNKETITTHAWKHGGGYPVAGDWPDFSHETVSFSNDTVYRNKKAVAVVDSVTTHYGEYRLCLKSLSGSGSGTYLEKGDVKKFD